MSKKNGGDMESVFLGTPGSNRRYRGRIEVLPERDAELFRPIDILHGFGGTIATSSMLTGPAGHEFGQSGDEFCRHHPETKPV